jgi:thiamine transporter
MRNKRILILAEAALAVALAVALNFMALRLPINFAGGSISLTMLPIAVVALRRGPVAGLAAGAIFGTLDLLMEPYIVYWAQVLLDYPLPYALFGLGCGAFARALNPAGAEPLLQERVGAELLRPPTNHPVRRTAIIVAAILTGGVLRYATHVASGVLFFAEYAAGQTVLIYSLVYNITYVAPSLAASALLAAALVPILNKALPPQ